MNDHRSKEHKDKLKEDNIVDKDLLDSCKHLQEKILIERNINSKNVLTIESMDKRIKVLELEVEKSNKRTIDIRDELNIKDNELKTANDRLNTEIIKNERKQHDIASLEAIIKQKEEELLKKNNDEPMEVIQQLKDELNRAKDMFLEYEHKIANITKEKDEELKTVKIAKKKVEEDYRNVIKEKQLLKDTERILLNTFDTLKKYYDAKDNSANQNSSDNSETDNTANEPRRIIKCQRCNYETEDEDLFRDHSNSHTNNEESGTDGTEQNTNNDRDIREDGSTTRRRLPSNDEKRNNGFCMYWNRGYCQHDDLCLFLHEEAPHCHFQEHCRRPQSCRFFHESFLDQGNNHSQRN